MKTSQGVLLLSAKGISLSTLRLSSSLAMVWALQPMYSAIRRIVHPSSARNPRRCNSQFLWGVNCH